MALRTGVDPGLRRIGLATPAPLGSRRSVPAGKEPPTSTPHRVHPQDRRGSAPTLFLDSVTFESESLAAARREPPAPALIGAANDRAGALVTLYEPVSSPRVRRGRRGRSDTVVPFPSSSYWLSPN